MVRSWRNKGQVGKRNLVQADCCSLRFLFSSRSDIAYRVGLISRLMNHPRLSHLLAAKRILRYVKGFLDYGFSNHGKNVSDEIFGYYDSVVIKLTACTARYVFKMCRAFISWCSKESVVALFSCETSMRACQAL